MAGRTYVFEHLFMVRVEVHIRASEQLTQMSHMAIS